MDVKKANNFRSIISSTAIFGGAQVISVIVNLIRGKLLATLLGAGGMGISALFTTTLQSIQQISILGTNLSVVLDISKSIEQKDFSKSSKIIKYFRVLVIGLAIFAASLTFLFAKSLSFYTFGSADHVNGFQLLSIAVFFAVLTVGETSILQGERRLKKFAKASISGPVSGLFIGVPLYFYLGNDGIVLALILLSISTYVANRLASKDETREVVKFNRQDFYQASRKLVALGVILTISILISSGVNYYLNSYIAKWGGVEQVGYYQAANTISNQYLGLVFTAMNLDYYPRLAAIAGQRKKVNQLVNEQLQIVLIIVAPLLSILIVGAPVIIRVLLSKDFLIITPLVQMMAFGMFFKAFSFPLGYISFSRGDKKVFFWLEGVLVNALLLTFNLILYNIYGLKGLAASFILLYLVYSVIMIIITYKLYKFRFTKESLNLFLVLGCAIAIIYGTLYFTKSAYYMYIMQAILIIMIGWYSISQLEKRLQIKSIILSKLKR